MFPARSAHAAGPAQPQLDAEKLRVYAVAVEFQTLASVLSPKGHAVLRDQLERASLSIVLNVAEGAGQRSRPSKNRSYSIARGSANECAAASTCCAPAASQPKPNASGRGSCSSASCRC